MGKNNRNKTDYVEMNLRLCTDDRILATMVTEFGLTDKLDIEVLSCLYANIQYLKTKGDSVVLAVPPDSHPRLLKIYRLLVDHGYMSHKGVGKLG